MGTGGIIWAITLLKEVCESLQTHYECSLLIIRPGDILKAAGLRPDYVLFYNTFGDFFESWEYCMKGRYIKLKSLDELMQLVVK